MLARNPADIEARLGLAKTLAHSLDYDAAIAEYDLILASSPREMRALLGKSLTMGWAGPLAVRFTVRTIFTPHTYFWTFGDGESSPVATPLHRYAEPGHYEVSLISRLSPGGSAGNDDVVVAGEFLGLVTNGNSGPLSAITRVVLLQGDPSCVTTASTAPACIDSTRSN